MVHELARRGVVVDHGDAGAAKRVEHGGGEFDQGAIAPERIVRAELRVEAVGHGGQ